MEGIRSEFGATCICTYSRGWSSSSSKACPLLTPFMVALLIVTLKSTVVLEISHDISLLYPIKWKISRMTSVCLHFHGISQLFVCYSAQRSTINSVQRQLTSLQIFFAKTVFHKNLDLERRKVVSRSKTKRTAFKLLSRIKFSNSNTLHWSCLLV